ncbi:MAG: hypothetical protein AB7S26_09505 [Sandaracinaceae bacterium]
MRAPLLRFAVLARWVVLAACLSGASALAAQDRPDVRVTTRVERPAEPWRRGGWSVDRWVPVAGGTAILLVAAGALVYRIRRRAR